MTNAPLLSFCSLVTLGLVLALGGGAAGCSTATYRVPGLEMRRLAYLPPAERGAYIRVVPCDDSTRAQGVVVAPAPVPPAPLPAFAPPPVIANRAGAVAALAPPPFDPASAVPVVEVEAPPTEPELVIQPSIVVEGGRYSPRDGRSGGVPRQRTAPAFSPGPTPVRGPPPISAAPLRAGISASASAPAVRGSAGALSSPPVMAAVPRGRVSASSTSGSPVHSRTSSSGGGHSSSVDGGDVIIALVAVVTIVGLVALIASSATPHTFDGWVRTGSKHPLHLSYANGASRVIALEDLRPPDLVGLRDTRIDGVDGSVEELEDPAAPAGPPPPVR
jgi:hypothetical protein